jgi:frataxin
MQSELNFQLMAKKTFAFLSSALEEVLEDRGEVEETEGILKIVLVGNNNTILLNLHAPSSQIWLSSPLTGALHFSWDDQQEKWLSTRFPHEDLLTCLKKDLSQLCGFSVDLR